MSETTDLSERPLAPVVGHGLAEKAAPTGPDPFADIDPTMGAAAVAQPTGEDPFADLHLPPVAPAETSGLGAFTSHAIRGLLPTAGGMAAAGAGAELGATIGAFGGPAAPVTVPLGGFIGGLAGFFAGSAATEGTQDWALHQAPDNWQEALGQSTRQQRLQEEQHPYYSFMGGIAPYALTMTPGAFTTKAAALPENATAFQKIMANPVTARAFGGAAMGGMELGQEAWHGQTPDWAKIGISTGFGLVFNKPTAFGEYLTGAGARTAGMFHQAVPREGLLNPAEPTVAQAADLGVVGPGITESTFQGTQEQSPATRASAHNAAADEQAALGALPVPDLDGIARRLDPEVFQRTDQLVAQRDSLRRWIQDQSNPTDAMFDDLAGKRYAAEEALRNANPNGPAARGFRAELTDIAAREQDLAARREAWENGTHVDTPDIMLARQHLLDTEHELWDLAPQLSAARRRAADHVGDFEPEPDETPVSPAEALTAPVPETPRLSEEPLAGIPPVAPGYARFFHGGSPENSTLPTSGGGRWTSPDFRYARDYRRNETGPGAVWYVDLPADHPAVKAVQGIPDEDIASGVTMRQFYGNVEVPEDLAKGFKPYNAAAVAAEAASQTAPKSPEAQRAFITQDRTAQLMGVGLSRQIAEASAHVEAAYYETLAARFGGALGTAEDLYRQRAARVVGPNGQVPPESTPPVTRAAPTPTRIRTIAEIQAEDGLSATRAKRIQDEEILARGKPIETVRFAPAPEPVLVGAEASPAATQPVAEPAPEPVATAPPAARPRLRTADQIAREDGIRDPKAVKAVQDQELTALADWQAQQPAAPRPPKRNRALDRLAADTGLPPVEAAPEAVMEAIVDRLPTERVIEEVNAAAEAGEIEYREAEKAAAEVAPEVLENPAAFYDSDQSRPLEALESEHRPPNEAATTEQRPGGGGEPEPAATGAGPVPEGGGPPEPVAGAGGRAEPEGGAAVAGEPGVIPAGAIEPTGARESAAGGEQGPATGAEPAGVRPPLLVTPENPDILPHTGISGNGGLESLDPAAIGVDAARFQFKAGGDEAGVTDRLQGVETWDPRLAGIAMVFRDAEGKDWIADGHQRLGLAQRLIDAGQTGIRLNAFVLDARDGMTEGQTRVIAAAKNIAEGTGTAVDAAKIVREAESAGIEVPPLPPRSTLVREGRALARLSPDAFGMAINDVVPIGQAAIVGRLVVDPAHQVEAIRVLAKAKPDNLRQAEIIVRDVMETATEATTQGGLFGEEHYAASATLERAKVADEAMRQLGRDRTTFHTLVSEAERIQGHGENVLDIEANRNRLTADEQARQLLTQLATHKGQVSDALTGIARRVRDGEISAAAGAREFLGVVRGRLSEGLGERPDARGAFLGAAREPELAAPDARDIEARDLLGQLIAEPAQRRVPEPTVRTDGRQIAIPGTEPSAVQAQAARDQAGRGALRASGEQRPADEGLFAPKEEPGGELFQRETPTWEELLERGRQVRSQAQRYAEADKPAAFQDRDGLRYLVSKDLNYAPDGWRVTMFNKEGEPVGHWEAKSAYEAFREVLAKQPEPVGVNHPEAPSLFQRTRAAIQGRIRIAPGDVRSVITLARTADASTFMHETSHDWLKQLLQDSQHSLAPAALKTDAGTIRAWLKRPEGWTGFKRDGSPDVVPQERFARGFEQYLREGHAPSRPLDSVFAQFKSWLTTIYRTLRGLGAPISEDIRGVFDRMLAIEPRRKTFGEVPERPPSIGDIHATDAERTHPREAEAVRDRVVSERDRYVAGQPPEIAHGFAASTDTTPDAGAGPGGEAEPRGEAGAGSTAGRTLDAGGGQSEPVTPGGGGGAERGAVESGGGQAEPEGAGVAGRSDGQSNPPNGRRGAGATSGVEQLAPRPAESFTDTEPKLVDRAGNIRVENLTDIDSIAQAIHDSADRNDEFRAVRGGMTKGQMLDLAESMGLDPSKIDEASLARLFGGAQDLGPKILAARRLVVQSAEIVSGLMKAAADGADHDVAALGVAIARHDMIQSVLAGVTAEWGRAGSAFHSLLTGWEKAQDLNQLLRDNLGRDLYQLKVIAKMGARLDTPGKISKYLRDARNRSFGGMILEYWINGLISGPATHATYTVGNTILAMEKAGPETAAAAMIGSLRARLGREGTRVRLGEVGAQLRGAIQEAPAAAQAGIEALRSGATTMLPGEAARPAIPFAGDTSLSMSRGMTNAPVTWHEVAGDAYGLMQGMRDGLVAIGEMVKAGEPGAPTVGPAWSPLGQIPDIQIRGGVVPLGTLARLPSRGVAAIHSTFRAMNYSMEINALAYRQAVEEGLSGPGFAARIADLRQNPSEEMMELARGKATDLTLMGQGGKLTNSLSALFNKTFDLPVLGETALLKFIDPFVHIAGNIMNQSLVQRTPIGLLFGEIRADLIGRNGNIAQDTAMAKMLVGTSLAMTFGGLAAQGLMSGSGPADPRKGAMWRLAGNQAHSVRIGDFWYDIHRLGPMGMLASVSADLYDVAHQIGKEDADVVGKSIMHAFTQNILDESFMRGPADLIKAVTDPDRYGSGYVRNFLTSFLPYSVGMSQVARGMDPYSRQARTIMDAIRAKVPGMSESLFPRRDVWGEPMPNSEALIGAGITSIYERQMSRDPVNQAMLALGIGPAPVERTIRNVHLTDEQYDEFARIAGRSTKMRLDAIVKSPDYQSWPNATRHDVVEETFKQSREAARGMMMMKYPEIPRQSAQMRIDRRTNAGSHPIE